MNRNTVFCFHLRIIIRIKLSARTHRAARDKNNTTKPKHIIYSKNQFGAGQYAYLHQPGRTPMSQASLPTPKSSECSNGSAVGLEPDRRHSAALKPSLSSFVACRTYQLDPVQRSANRATCSSERTRNNSSFLDSRHRKL